MLFYGCKTSSKLGHFPKLKNLIFSNRPGPELVNTRDLKNLNYLATQFRQRSSKLVVQIDSIFFGLVKKRVVTLLFFNFMR